jgi:site-specific DNA recombinase
MNYLIARVSDPTQKIALPAQRKKLYDYAEKQCWAEGVDCTYVEFDETAFKENRVKFQDAVIKPLLSATGTSICVFDKVDRFSRDSSSDEKNVLMKLLKKGAIEMHFPSDNLFMHKNSPAPDLFRLDIGVSLAGYYSSAIRDNVRRRFDQMLHDGIWVGRAPIGYLNYIVSEDDRGNKVRGIKLDPERDFHIRRGFELRSTGLSYKAIAKQLKKDGLVSKTKKRIAITTTQWEQILNNPFYYGEMRFMGKLYEHHYDPLIEKWLWDKCQDVKNRRSSARTKYNSKPFLFKTMKCEECGYSIAFDGPKKDGNVYGKCTEYKGKHGAKWVQEKKLIDQVKGLFKDIHVPNEIMPDIIAEIEKNHSSEQKFYLDTKKRLQKEYDTLDQEVVELFEDRKAFKTRPELFEKMVKQREARQKVILQELEDHSNGDKAFVIGASYIIEVCSKATELFEAESSTIEQKRYLLDFVLSSITLKGEKLELTLKEPFEAILLMAKTGNWLRGLDSNQRPSGYTYPLLS